jgi:hypothetical protein
MKKLKKNRQLSTWRAFRPELRLKLSCLYFKAPISCACHHFPFLKSPLSWWRSVTPISHSWYRHLTLSRHTCYELKSGDHILWWLKPKAYAVLLCVFSSFFHLSYISLSFACALRPKATVIFFFGGMTLWCRVSRSPTATTKKCYIYGRCRMWDVTPVVKARLRTKNSFQIHTQLSHNKFVWVGLCSLCIANMPYDFHCIRLTHNLLHIIVIKQLSKCTPWHSKL